MNAMEGLAICLPVCGFLAYHSELGKHAQLKHRNGEQQLRTSILYLSAIARKWFALDLYPYFWYPVFVTGNNYQRTEKELPQYYQ